MRVTISPEQALVFTKLSVIPAAVWPPDRNSDKFKIKWSELLWCASVISPICLLLPLLASIPTYKDNPIVVSKSICLSCAVTQVIIKALVCRVHRKKIQFLLEGMNIFLRRAELHERVLCQKYVNKHALLHIIVTLCCYGAAFFVICGPMLLPFPLPTEAIYPFPVNSSPVWELVYVHQATVGFQSSAGMCVDSLVAFLLWFTGIRLELLYQKFRRIKDRKDMFLCIREHQSILRYGKELTEAFRYVIFATVFSVTTGLAFAGIYLFSPQPIFVKGQFVIVSISAAVNLYITASPSDNLIHMCNRLSDAVYESLWLQSSSCIPKNWLNVVQRAQKPITIKIPGLIKELSLQYYFSVLSSTFSYFTALRVILTNENE